MENFVVQAECSYPGGGGVGKGQLLFTEFISLCSARNVREIFFFCGFRPIKGLVLVEKGRVYFSIKQSKVKV